MKMISERVQDLEALMVAKFLAESRNMPLQKVILRQVIEEAKEWVFKGEDF